MTVRDHNGGDVPANISQRDWEDQCAELAEVAASVRGQAALLTNTNRNMVLLRDEMRSLKEILLRLDLATVKQRLDKFSDWRQTTERKSKADLESEVAEYKAKEEKRMALWLRVTLIVLGALAEGLAVHYFH